ncbi:ubiquinol-cytochrome c reductase core subunit 1, partial [Ascosphaera atra]
HEVGELVLPQIKFSQDAFNSSAPVQALSQAHTSAFHSGLGSSLVPSLNGPWKKNVQADAVSCFAKCAFNKSGLAIVGSGHNTADLSKWINQFFPSLPATVGTGPYAPKPATESKYFGGESRTASSVGNALVLGFPGSSIAGSKGYNAAYYVLAELLGGQSNIKWSRGTSLLSAIKASVPDVSITTLNNAYSDAGLFTISLSGSASGIAKAGKPVVEAIQKVASGEVAAEEVQRAVSLALFRAVDTDNAERAASQLLNNGKILTLSEVGNSIQNVTAADVQKAAKSLLEGKASVAAVGDLDVLPWANEIGVSV